MISERISVLLLLVSHSHDDGPHQNQRYGGTCNTRSTDVDLVHELCHNLNCRPVEESYDSDAMQSGLEAIANVSALYVN